MDLNNNRPKFLRDYGQSMGRPSDRIDQSNPLHGVKFQRTIHDTIRLINRDKLNTHDLFPRGVRRRLTILPTKNFSATATVAPAMQHT